MQTKNILIGAGLLGIVALVLKNEVAKSKPPKIFYRKTMAGNYNARTIPPFGIYILESEKGNEMLLKHELIHWEQYKKLGLLRYYIDYQNQLAQYGYDKMPMEMQARINESQWVKENYTLAVRNGFAKTVYNPDFRK